MGFTYPYQLGIPQVLRHIGEQRSRAWSADQTARPSKCWTP